MGIGGHILGDRRLRKLRRDTGIDFDRAYLLHNYGEGVVWTEDGCQHYNIEPATWTVTPFEPEVHWSTCNPNKRAGLSVCRSPYGHVTSKTTGVCEFCERKP